MKTARAIGPVGPALVCPAGLSATTADAADPFTSRTDGKVRGAVVGFVAKVANDGSPSFVPHPERIAVFDSDGRLWIEQPMSVQLAFALDRQPTSSRPIPGRLSWRVLSSAPTSGTASAAGRRPNRRSACSAV